MTGNLWPDVMGLKVLLLYHKQVVMLETKETGIIILPHTITKSNRNTSVFHF